MKTTATKVEGATMKISRKRRLVLGLALGLTAASVLAGPAGAKPEGLEDSIGYSSESSQPVRPDDQAVRVSPTVAEIGADGWAAQYADSRNVQEAPGVLERSQHLNYDVGGQPTLTTTDDGVQIDWRDAGFGALGATALFGLMAGMALAIRHGRQGGGLAAS
jgi:hypothetical protein